MHIKFSKLIPRKAKITLSVKCASSKQRQLLESEYAGLGSVSLPMAAQDNFHKTNFKVYDSQLAFHWC